MIGNHTFPVARVGHTAQKSYIFVCLGSFVHFNKQTHVSNSLILYGSPCLTLGQLVRQGLHNEQGCKEKIQSDKNIKWIGNERQN